MKNNLKKSNTGFLIGVTGCIVVGVMLLFLSAEMLYHFVEPEHYNRNWQHCMQIYWVDYYNVDPTKEVQVNYHEPYLKNAPLVGEVRKKYPAFIKDFKDNIYMSLAVITEDNDRMTREFDAINMEDQDPENYKKTKIYAQHFTNDQISNGAAVVSYTFTEGDGYKIENNTMTLGGKRLAFIQGSDINELIWKSAPDQMKVARIEIALKQAMPNSQIDQIKKKAAEVFPTTFKVDFPQAPSFWNVQHKVLVWIAFVLVEALVAFLLSFLVVFAYRNRRNQVENEKTDSDIRKMEWRYLGELFVCEVIGTVIAGVLFMFVIAPLVDNVWGALSSMFTVLFTAVILLSFYVVSFAVFRIRICKCDKVMRN